jgi:four helix bundle protein
MGNFKKLEVWTESKELAVYIYKITSSGLLSKDYGLRDQMRRAAVSVPSNLAEGEESGSLKKGISYFHISKGSLAELQTQVIICSEIDYFNNEELDNIETRINSLSAKLRKLIQYRESKLSNT